MGPEDARRLHDQRVDGRTGSAVLVYSPGAFTPYGHAADYVSGLARGFEHHGRTVTCVGLAGAAALCATVRRVELRPPPSVDRLLRRSGRQVRRQALERPLLRLLAATWEELGRPAVLFETFEYLALARFLRRNNEIRAGCVLHEADFAQSGQFGPGAWYKRASARQVRTIVAGTRCVFVHGAGMRDSLIRTVGLPERLAARVTPLQYGADHPDEVHRVARGTARAALGLPTDVPLLLAFGTVRSDKDYELVLDALARTTDWHLVVAGPRGDRDVGELRRLVREGGIDHRVHFHTRFVDRQTQPLYFGAADMVAACYDPRIRHESGGAQTARSFGVPVLASGPPDLRRYVVDNGVGWAVPSRDAAAVAALLNRLAHSPAELETAAQRCEEAARRLSWRSVAGVVLEGIE